jgi:NAD(P)H dehydrogenase (quinone)
MAADRTSDAWGGGRVIAVLGATGRVGGHVATGLAERGIEARALTRQVNADLPIPAVHADLDTPETLRTALDGVEQLLLLTPHGPRQESQEAAVIDAAVTAGVARIVKISGSAPSLGPNGPTPTAVAHWRGEQRIERSGLQFAFLRPSFYMQNLLDTVAPTVAATGVLAAPFGNAPIAMVDIRDVAACAVAALLADAATSRAWQLTGPRPVTFPMIAEHLGARHLKVPVRVAMAAMRRRGLPAFEVEHAARMSSYFAAGSDGVATDHVLRLTGRPPRSIETFLDEHHDAFSPATTLARILSHHTTKEQR